LSHSASLRNEGDKNIEAKIKNLDDLEKSATNI
jgi:hypothetical protein